MSTAHLRLIAVAVTAIAAAITGVSAGLVTAGEDGFNVTAAVVGFGGAAATGVLLVILLIAATKRGEQGASEAQAATDAESANTIATLQAHLDQLGGERASLVNTCVYVRDRATSRAIADRIGQSLHDVGVVTLAPTGVPFDPAHHEAGGHTPAPDPSKAGMIAAVEVPGYVDNGTLLRAPVVTVYRQREA